MSIACPRCGSSDVIPLPGNLSRGVSCFGCGLCLHVWDSSAALPPPEPAEPQEVAQVQGKVLGFRAWVLSGGLLGSIAQPGGWTIGVNEARCLRPAGAGGAPHPAPAQGCQCGLYAHHKPTAASALAPGDYLYGAILAWGRIEVHPQGFRAQYAEPVMLAYHDHQPYSLVRRAQALASEMGIECVQWDEFERKAMMLGNPIAPELRPAYLSLPGYGGYVGASMGYAPVAPGIGPGVYIGPPTPSYYPSPRRKPP